MRDQIIPIHGVKTRRSARRPPQIITVDPEAVPESVPSWRWLFVITLVPVFLFLAACYCVLHDRQND